MLEYLIRKFMSHRISYCVALGIVLLAQPARCGTLVINFESFLDSDAITNQLPGLTFTNTTVLTAGIGLNEIDFPPQSGTNLVFDSGGPITISFSFLDPVAGFSAFFTYTQPLTILAFDALSNQVVSATSSYSNNTTSLGDPGSSPNEFLSVAFGGGISSVSITGDLAGGSFVMDDVTLDVTSSDPVPEPGSILLMLGGLGVLGVRRLRRT